MTARDDFAPYDGSLRAFSALRAVTTAAPFARRPQVVVALQRPESAALHSVALGNGWGMLGTNPVSDPPQSLQQALAERYVIERELGHGGGATVYLARDLKVPRHVALKVLAPELALAVRSERFRREIEIAAGLNHPHILPLFEADSAGGFVFYTMPPVEGESLHDRLARQGPLPIEEALDITRQVAQALDYAHRRGVIHRDIKPGNILLAGSHAWVADFGIARAIAKDTGERLTETGSPLGTVSYMSPEQINGAARVDGRTDVYSLGCVLYEMLTGAPPFTGPTLESVVAKQLVDPAPSLAPLRPEVPEGVVQVVERALAKDPANRFRTAGELLDALAVGRPGRPPWRLRLPRPVAIALVFSTVVAAWATRTEWGSLFTGLGKGGRAAADTLRYLVLPFVHQGEPVALLNEDQLLRDALNGWRGITLVDQFQANDALARRDSGVLTAREAQRVAVGLGAGRYVRGDVSRYGDSIRVHAGVYDAPGGVLLREETIKLGTDLRRADSTFGVLAERLLFGEAATGRFGATTGTRSFAARLAFSHGQAAVEQWDLQAADSAFGSAAQHDPQYAQAFLWLAQTRYWNGTAPARWRSSAERAAAGQAQLSTRDRALSDALLALGRGEMQRACSVWDALTHREPYDFTAWYGLATCLTRDSTVVRDLASESGWRFRASYHHALRSYQRAFQLLPSIHRSLRDNSFRAVRRLLLTDGNERLAGHTIPPDTTTFFARPSWEGDSLVLVPFSVRAVREARFLARPEQRAAALRQQRRLFHDIAAAWTAAYPESPDAVEAVAVALDLLGDPACLDTLRRARTLVSTPDQRLRLAGNQVWLQMKYSLPSDLVGVRGAKALADSVLRMGRPPGLARLQASLAVLTGRASLAASLSRDGAEEWRAPGAIARTAPPLLIYATFGGPADSLRALERQVAGAIENIMAAPEREPARMEWLARPAVLAYPDYRLESISRLNGSGDYLVDAQAAFMRGDTVPVRRMFANLRIVRQPFAPQDLMLDGLYPEASLLAALGDPREAVAWLDPTLNAIAGTAPEVFTDPARAGALVQAMRLRAELADRMGDREAARRWARLVVILWSDADEFLQPVVGRMVQLSS